MAVNTTQGIVLAIFGANAGGHLTSLDANATANGNASLATDLSAAAGLILGVDLSTDAAFTSTVLGNLGIAEGTDGYTLASNYFTTNLAAGAGRGDLVATAVEYLLGDNVDASLTESATAFSTRVTDGVTYSQGDGASVFGVSALQTAAGSAATAGEGQSFALTSAEDTLSGTNGDDTFTGTTANLSADDRILDSSATDNDTFNLTATTDPVAMDVTNVENINIDWDSYGTADIDLDNVSGATVTLTSAKSGYLGNANFDNVEGNSVSVGAGITGTVTVDGIEDATVTATAADNIDVGTGAAADGTITVNAGVAETVNLTGADDAVIIATAATDVTVDAAWDTAVVTLGVDADLSADGAADGALTINSDADIEVELQDTWEGESITLGGSGAIELTFEDGDDADAVDIFNGGVVKLAAQMASGIDLSDVVATEINFEAGNAAATTHEFAPGANVVMEADGGFTTTFATTAADDGTNDSITLTVETDQTGLDFVGSATTDFETVNLNINETPTTGTDVTIASLIMGTADTLNVTSTDNDLEITAVTAGVVNATAVAKEFTTTQVAAAAFDMVISGGSDDNTVEFTTDAEESTFVGQGGDDAVTFATTTGVAAAILGAGNNTVTANAVTSGTLTVEAGAGNDVVSATGLTSGEVNLVLSDGDNEVTLDGTLAGVEVAVTTGGGADEFTIGAQVTTTATDEIIINGGDGADSITFSANGASSTTDMTAGTFTLTGIETIEFLGGSASVILDGALLGGADYTLKGDGDVTDLVNVEHDSAGTYDYSTLSIDGTIAKAIGGLNVTGHTGADTITGTDGNDTIDGSTGNDVIVGGLGADSITLGNGNDTFVVGKKSATQTSSFAAANSTNDNIDDIVAFVAADDTIQLSSATGAYITGVALSTDATVNVVNLGVVATDSTADFAELVSDAAAAATEVASSADTVYVYIASITASGTADELSDGVDGEGAHSYLIINDGTTAITAADTFIGINAITGVIDSTNFTIV